MEEARLYYRILRLGGVCVEMERLGCSGSWMNVAGWLLRGDESEVSTKGHQELNDVPDYCVVEM